jgi:hypothetical protein
MRYVFVIFLLALFSCKKNVSYERVCVNQFASYYNGGGCADASVEAYSFQNATVYLFKVGTCIADVHADVVNTNCQIIGTVGGFGGNNIINGENFLQKAVFIKTVWKR